MSVQCPCPEVGSLLRGEQKGNVSWEISGKCHLGALARCSLRVIWSYDDNHGTLYLYSRDTATL